MYDTEDRLRSEIVVLIPALRAFAHTFHRNNSDADDLVQETLLKALANLDKFQPGTNLKSWMFTIMRNTFCSRAKLAKREAPGRDDDCGASAGSVPPKQEWHLRGLELEEAMLRLSPSSRAVIRLVAIEGETYEAAAIRLHCAVGTVKSRLNRARIRLAAELREPQGRVRAELL